MEQQEIDLLNGKGFIIPVKLLGRTFNFKCKKLTLGRLLKIADVQIKMQFDEESMTPGNFAAQFQAVHNNAKNAVKLIAICVTDNPLLRPIIRRALLNQYEPAQLFEFTKNFLKTSDYANFISSIALMNGNRPTKAMKIEE